MKWRDSARSWRVIEMSADQAQGFADKSGRPARSDVSLHVLATPGFADYALVDSGNGRKLERFGRFTVDRPEPQAMWQPALEPGVWLRADAAFRGGGDDEDGEGGRWRKNAPMPETWPLRVLGVTVLCRLTSFRHLGAFPEQLPHWEWMRARLDSRRGGAPRVLNLFAYTGAASLIAAAAGAEVTHVDASKRAIAWAKENQAVSKLASSWRARCGAARPTT
jgi:23S rRNA (cytosine1962-C5)-methyltransferase